MNLEETLAEIEKADDNHLFILWTNADPVVAHEMVFMYAKNAKKNELWEKMTIIVWGATTKLAAEDLTIQAKIKELQELGIHFTACVSCAKDLGVEDKIEALGIDLIKWLHPMTALLKGNKKLLTV